MDDAASEGGTSPQWLKKWMSANYENRCITMFHNVKVTAVELVSNVSSFIHYFFNPPEAEKGPADRVSGGLAGIERTMGASLMGLATLVIMVVLLKRVFMAALLKQVFMSALLKRV